MIGGGSGRLPSSSDAFLGPGLAAAPWMRVQPGTTAPGRARGAGGARGDEVRDRIGLYAHVFSQETLTFHKISTTAPLLVAVKHGRKVLSHKGRMWSAGPGQLLIMPAYQTEDIRNEVDADGVSGYAEDVLCLKPEFIDALSKTLMAAPPLQDNVVVSLSCPGLCESIDAAMEALAGGALLPREIIAHRVAEPLLWLTELIGRRLTSAANFSKRVRLLLSEDLSRSWTVESAAELLHMSVSTLKRGLAAEATSFAELMTGARMCEALALLKTTGMTVTDVAAAVGYGSQSRFAARFRRQFAVSPSQLRRPLHS